MLFLYLLFVLLVGLLLFLLFYWLIIDTEGAFLGRRVVVWLYDLTAHRYDAIKEFDTADEEHLVVRPLMAALADCPAPVILDVATGTGRVPFDLLQQPTFTGTLGRKTSDCTVRPGSWANNSARAGGMNLIVTTGSGSVACTVTSSRGAM